MARIIIEVKVLAQRLSAPITPALRNAALAIATAIRDRIAPYPPVPPRRNPNRWYERGYGPRWRRRDGSIGGRRTSEQMDRRWDVRPYGGTGAQVRNLASYSGYVQSAARQTAQHRTTGWKTDQWGIDQVVRDGTVERIVTQEIERVLGL